jgi:hypothetical protein
VADHGTRTRYYYDMCRCDACVEANSEYLRRYRSGDVHRQRAEADLQKRIGEACASFISKRHPRIYKRLVKECTDGE